LHFLSVSIALSNQHAKSKCHTILLFWPYLTVYFFPHYLITTQFSEEKLLNKHIVFDLSSTSFGKVSSCKKNSAQYFLKCKVVYMLSNYYSSQNITKQQSAECFEISVFFYPSNRRWVIRFGPTDGRIAITNIILTFRKCAKRLIDFTLFYLVNHLQGTYLRWFDWEGQCLRILYLL